MQNFVGLSLSNAELCQVGGPTPAERNVLSGNTFAVTIAGSGAKDNIVTGNYIGTDAAGNAAIPNFAGVSIQNVGTGNVVGNLGEANNIISGNLDAAVVIQGLSTTVAVMGNRIGTDATGVNAIPNQDGIETRASSNGNPSDIQIGLDDAPNDIAFNTFNGILIGGQTTFVDVINNHARSNGQGVVVRDQANGVLMDSSNVSNNAGAGVSAEGTATLKMTNCTVTGNGGAGAVVLGDVSADIANNFIFGNVGLGIDLGGNGVTVMFSRAISACFLICTVASAAPLRRAENAVANGLGLNLPLAARLVGSGNILYTTSIDVANHTPADTQVDFYFDGLNLRTQETIVITGTVTNDGLREHGSGVLRGRSSAHFEDFVSALAAAELLSQDTVADGVLGSVLFVFNGHTKSGQASVIARFENDLADGTVGVSLRAREITAREPQRLVAAVRDSRGNTRGDAQLYPNLFINNLGLTPAGQATSDTITVEVSAVSSRTGQSVGTPLNLSIRGGQTASVGSVLQALQVPAGEESVLVTARVTSGNAAIQGIVSQIDATTRDGSVFEMSRADF